MGPNRITSTDEGGIAIYFTEITERKRLERDLRECEAQLRFATEGAGIGTWSWDPHARTAEWSPMMLALWGFERPLPFDAPDFLATVHPDDRTDAEA